MASVTSITAAIIMTTMVATVLVAVAIGLPWYRAEDPYSGRTVEYYLDYAKSDTSGFYSYGVYDLEDLQFLMWVEKVFAFIWIAAAIAFVGTCFIDDKWTSLAHGFGVVAVSVFVIIYFAARIGRAHDWSWDTSAGIGYVLVLFAFAMQFLAIVAHTWQTLPLVRAGVNQQAADPKI